MHVFLKQKNNNIEMEQRRGEVDGEPGDKSVCFYRAPTEADSASRSLSPADPSSDDRSSRADSASPREHISLVRPAEA